MQAYYDLRASEKSGTNDRKHVKFAKLALGENLCFIFITMFCFQLCGTLRKRAVIQRHKIGAFV